MTAPDETVRRRSGRPAPPIGDSEASLSFESTPAFALDQTVHYAQELHALYKQRRIAHADLDARIGALERAQDKLLQTATDLAHTHDLLIGTYESTLRALMLALDLRDGSTGGHSVRVVSYAEEVGRRLGVGPEVMREIHYGALLHDVGKIAIPDTILRKPGPLTDDEWCVMRRHPELGFEMFRDVEYLRFALPIIRHHHERWDGQGYPDGLSADSIPQSARIFAVADAFDALTADRVYRPGRSVDLAVSELELHTGTQFDPDAVNALVGIADFLHTEIAAGSCAEAV